MRKPIIVFFLAALAIPAQSQDDVLVKAMKDELARSIGKLQLENLEKPYFISYRVFENEGRRASAQFGTLVANPEFHSRYLTVEVRVGDYKLDNTNFVSRSFGGSGVMQMFGGTTNLPLEDDYREIRRQIWLATDSAYKKALEDISKKRAALANKTHEEIPDLSKEQAASVTEESKPVRFDPAEMEKMARELSALFREMPDVFMSSVNVNASNSRVVFVSSEGAFYRRVRGAVSFIARAQTRASDGLPIGDVVAHYGRSVADLPGKDQLAAEIRKLGANLKDLRAASTLDQYNGPVLFEGDAAAELVNQEFAPNLAGTRRPVSDNPGFERMSQQMESPFIDRIGGRVLPDFLSVTDNPTAAEYSKTPLAGWYKVDDDGIPARETKVVEKGMLTGLLMSRNPVRGFAQSTGNRRGADTAPSNLFLTAENGVSAVELRDKLIGLVKQRRKEFGIVVRRIRNPSLHGGTGGGAGMGGQQGDLRVGPAILAYKVFPDGREELIRNLEFSGMSAASFKEILAASKELTVYTAPFRGRRSSFGGFFPEEAASDLVSIVTPSLLFEDVTLRKPTGEFPKPPIAKHPYFDK